MIGNTKEPFLVCKFERLNSKHNRVWQQFTSLITFTGTIITAFVGALFWLPDEKE